MRTLSILFLITILSFSCSGGGQQESTSETATEAEAPAKKYTITPFSNSVAYPDAKITSMDYVNGKFKVGIESSTYKLGEQTADADQKMCANSGQGQHIHMIVDNGPYSAYYTNEFEQAIGDGEHYILAFLSRSYHESIKTATAFTAKKVTIAGGNFKSTEDITAPMLFYSRPKGAYVGDKETKKVMLDFYLTNVTLGNDYKVKAEINGEEHILDTWQPYYVEGMDLGENTIKLTLIDKDGNAVNTPLNPVERTFSLAPEPAPTN